VLFEGQNDSLDDAERVLQMLKGIKAKVNLIPYNENPERELTRPREERVEAFQQYFLDNGMTCTVRTTRGLDINAACGQLGKAYEQAQDLGWLEDARARVGLS
jgi:23S rRNA (adenine2503-C2)-methyltransferase